MARERIVSGAFTKNLPAVGMTYNVEQEIRKSIHAAN
jgi:hypothetical protein